MSNRYTDEADREEALRKKAADREEALRKKAADREEALRKKAALGGIFFPEKGDKCECKVDSKAVCPACARSQIMKKTVVAQKQQQETDVTSTEKLAAFLTNLNAAIKLYETAASMPMDAHVGELGIAKGVCYVKSARGWVNLGEALVGAEPTFPDANAVGSLADRKTQGESQAGTRRDAVLATRLKKEMKGAVLFGTEVER